VGRGRKGAMSGLLFGSMLAASKGTLRLTMRLAFQFGSRMKAALTLLAAILSPAALYAQGCAMCYQTAANSGNPTVQALKRGILLMLFPPLVIASGILYMAYQKRNQFNRGAGTPHSDLSGDGNGGQSW
jgi:hypothetical protein